MVGRPVARREARLPDAAQVSGPDPCGRAGDRHCDRDRRRLVRPDRQDPVAADPAAGRRPHRRDRDAGRANERARTSGAARLPGVAARTPDHRGSGGVPHGHAEPDRRQRCSGTDPDCGVDGRRVGHDTGATAARARAGELRRTARSARRGRARLRRLAALPPAVERTSSDWSCGWATHRRPSLA